MSASSSNDHTSITVYHGERKCEASQSCKNRGYYLSRGVVSCGVHARSDGNRITLPENPNKRLLEEERLNALKEAALNANKGKLVERGRLALQRLGFMKPIPMVHGYITVLPNRRAKVANDGVVWAVNELSPMLLGPVVHKQPDVDAAENLENFHQFNKVFRSEYDEKTDQVMQVWYERRTKGYADRQPHRHKLGATKQAHLKAAGGNHANACLFSVYVTPDGQERRYSYLESRVFYCTFYERLARQTSAMTRLVDALYVDKRNLIIAGYDGLNAGIDDEITSERIQEWYENPHHPFGHELVLFAILWHWNTPDLLPWRKAAEKLGYDL